MNDSSPKITPRAIEALMNSDCRENYELIFDCLKYDSDIEVKKNALIALYNLSDRMILDEVINGDFAEELKEYARQTLRVYEDIDE